MAKKEKDVMDGMNNFLLYLKKSNQVVNVGQVATRMEAPYKQNLTGVLTNMNLVKFVRRGAYLPNIEIVDNNLVESVINECRKLAISSKAESRKTESVFEEKTQAVREVVREVPVNPFGFGDFDYIMVEKGKIVIGEYTLVGSFTLTKNNSNVVV